MGAEDGDAAGRERGGRGVTEGLHAFIGLLTVIETRSHTVDVYEWRRDKLRGGPLGAGGVGEVGFNMAVDWEISMR